VPDRAATVSDFSRPDHLTRPVVDQGQPRRPTAQIDFDAQRLRLHSRPGRFPDDGEGVTPKDGRFALLEE
jgi:hypothetical protein